jgi:hypothetical protein
MANGVNAPFGLRPIRSLVGNEITNCLNPYVIASNYNTSIGQNDPVTLSGTGGIAGNGIVIGAAAGPWVGTLKGIKYVSTTGETVVSEGWIAGTPVMAGTEVVAMVYDDPNLLFEVQVAGGTNTLIAADPGNNANVVIGAPSAIGVSTTYLSQGTIANTANLSLKIYGLSRTLPNNNYGVLYNIALAKINNHVYNSGTGTAGI